MFTHIYIYIYLYCTDIHIHLHIRVQIHTRLHLHTLLGPNIGMSCILAALPLTTITIIFVGSCYIALYRNYRLPTKMMVLVVDGRVLVSR